MLVRFILALTALALVNLSEGRIDCDRKINRLTDGTFGMAAASAFERAFFAGGRSLTHSANQRVDIYNPLTGSWSVERLSSPRSYLAAAGVGSLVFFAGGYDATKNDVSNIVDVFDVNTQTQKTTVLSLPRSSLAATSINNRVLFAGGQMSPAIFNSQPSDLVDIYEVEENGTFKWSVAKLSVARWDLAAASVNGKAFFAGGVLNELKIYSAAVDIYDFATEQWSTASLSSKRTSMGATSVGNLVLFAGGDDGDVGGAVSTVDVYNDVTGKWSKTSLKTEPRYGLAAASTTRYAFFGGGSRLPLIFNLIDVYDVVSNTWGVLYLNESRADVAAIAVDDIVFFVGGRRYDNGQQVSNCVDMFFDCETTIDPIPPQPPPEPEPAPVPIPPDVEPEPEPFSPEPTNEVPGPQPAVAPDTMLPPTWVWIVASVGSVLVIGGSIIAACRCINSGRAPGYQSLDKEGINDAITIKPQDLKIKEIIGRGGFSVVYRGLWRKTPVAIKQFNHTEDDDPFDTFEFFAEARIMLNLRHPNIVTFMGVCVMPKSLALVTELLELGSLAKILRNPDVQLENAHLRDFAIDVSRGMAYLHASKIIHRDLKTRNLLVDRHWTVKVADFGLSREQTVNHTMNTMTACGTGPWIAPEVLREHHYSFAADVYSFAICLWELSTRRKPYQNIPQYQVVISVATKGMRPKINESEIPAPFIPIIRQCWDEDSRRRPTFEDLVQILEGVVFPKPQHDKPLFKEKKESSGSSTEIAMSMNRQVGPRASTDTEHKQSDHSGSSKSSNSKKKRQPPRSGSGRGIPSSQGGTEIEDDDVDYTTSESALR